MSNSEKRKADNISKEKALKKEIELLKKELKDTIKSLAEISQNLNTFFETAIESITIHQNGKVVDANQATCKTFDYTKRQIIGKSIFHFVHPEFHKTVQEKVRAKSATSYEIMMVRKGNKSFLARLKSGNILYKGSPARIVVIKDITEIKDKENRIIESERKFSVLSHNFPGIAYRCKLDKNLTMLFLSDGFNKLTGYKSQDFINNKKLSFNDIIYPEDKGNKNLKKALKRKKIYELEYRIITAKKEIKWVWEKGQGVFDVNGKLLFLEGFIADINEKKQYEIELKKSRESYKQLFDFSPDGIIVHIDGKVIFSNKAAVKMMAVKNSNELKNKSVLEYILPEFHKQIIDRMKLGKQGVDLDFAEIKIKNKKGEIKSIETKPIQIDFDGLKATQVIFRDITEQKELFKEHLRAQVAEETNKKLQKEINERKKAEQILLSNQKYTRLLIESSLDMICAADKDGNIIEFNLAAQATFGYKKEEIIGKNIKLLYAFPEEKNHITRDELLGNGIYIGEVVNVKKNGEQFVSFLSASVLRNEKGEVVGSMGVSRDISESKKAEMELRNSEERYRAIYNQAYIGIAKTSLEGKFLQVNQQLCNILGYSNEELCQMNFIDITAPEDVDLSVGYWSSLLSGSFEKATFEKKYLHRSGKEININLTISLVFDSDGNPLHFITVYQDITDRIRAEKERQSQTAKLNAVIESGSHLIWTVDGELSLTSFNRNFKNFLKQQFDIDVSVGSSLIKSPIVSNDYNNSLWKKKYSLTLAGMPQYFETNFINEAGVSSWYEIFLNPIFDEKEKVIEISAIGHDITEKILANEKIQLSLQEKEVLLKEVHHRVKNNLQVISSILNLQSSYVKDWNTLNILKESQNRIKSMAFIHESLYQTKDFSNINFSEYIANLSKNLIQTYSDSDCEIKLYLDVQTIFLNLDLAIPSGLIINELVSNAIKYAFDDKKKENIITISMHLEGEDVKLSLGDNGKGLPERLDFRNTESLGLQLVVTLVDQINGEIQIDKNQGTKYLIEFKQNQIKNRI